MVNSFISNKNSIFFFSGLAVVITSTLFVSRKPTFAFSPVNAYVHNVCSINIYTVEPVLSGHPLSGHPRLGGQLSKSRMYSRYDTVNKTLIWRPPLLSVVAYNSTAKNVHR